MADMRTAILRAAQAADRLHKEFDTKTYTDGEEGRINVFGMMADRDLPVMFRPLDKLLGAYLNEGSPGVIITTQRQLPVQRCTAAHELGHAVLGHTPSLDPEDILMRSPFGAKVAGGADQTADGLGKLEFVASPDCHCPGGSHVTGFQVPGELDRRLPGSG